MIKAIVYLLCLSVCLPLSVEANVTTEKQRLLDELQSSIQYMQGIATRGTREPIVFEALKPHQAFDPKQAEHFIALPAQTEHAVPTLQTFFTKSAVQQRYQAPYHFFNIAKQEDQLATLLGVDQVYLRKNRAFQPNFIPTVTQDIKGNVEHQIAYLSVPKIVAERELDGEVPIHHLSDIEHAVYATQTEPYTQVVIESEEPLKRVSFNIELALPRFTTQQITHFPYAIDTAWGKIEFLQVIGNALVYRVPANIADKMMVYALYQDGRALAPIETLRHPLLTEAEKTYHHQLANLFTEVHRLVKLDKIKTEAEIRQFFQSRQPFPPDVDEKQQRLQITSYYSGDITKIVLYLPEPAEKHQFRLDYSVPQVLGEENEEEK
ncbi:TPA: hypothetical protein QB360_001071 [Pasteurella multocida]|uniref:hypothetical protein n=1 Tax=Pasteurella multocida TaxID=747 RepID=UPI00202088BB|nr:hypothetical protein [Pasteurella multocida]MCL7816736.1 hypothetical protein [Pasteurella multocida]HDR1026208.1 hypothetical protein [Pasteurella multocida]